ncbi:hypothetical protein FisN_3Lh384 [Fistulifera solaris]|uniref:Hemerythrin-like domain-containing protein n=1 Tax=Fistulifera solaris TaxID=1519565 RepID=A0A1Z5J8A8_FISSO|nr:hypothetical protein FisN_3Lh384 [Fistulifera solaris]|eukprot:GAX10189.1 hypothetical protein FisN_3Lh384 [Fistulifera solaris]
MSEEKPEPQIFAIMRNGHEVIRGGMLDMKEAIDNDDIQTAKEVWQKLHKWTEIHKRMEEGKEPETEGCGCFQSLFGGSKTKKPSPCGFFQVLDEKRDGVVTKNGLHVLHAELDKVEKAVDVACKKSDLRALKEAFPKFQEMNESHLKKEEDIMMPNVMEMKKAGEPMKKIMTHDILPLVSETSDYEFFVKYANQVLEKHHGGMPRARVFDHALWAASTPEEWKKVDGWIKNTLHESTYKQLQAVL